MNGAESLVRTLTACGVEVCFANPGTSEMHLVAALDRGGARCVLGLFEGVVTGAADGYARMAGKPAATLLHLGPGLANGLANLHNARARQPDGQHRRRARHRSPGLDAPLTTDIEALAARSRTGCTASRRPRGRRATPRARSPRRAAARPDRDPDPAGRRRLERGRRGGRRAAGDHGTAPVAEEQVAAVAGVLRPGEPTLLFLPGRR